MTNTTTAREMSTADQLRAALKAAGYSRKQVTVKHDHYSMGSSLYVTIRDASVPKSKVEAIAASFEIVRRCESSGEILGGGNRFLHVDYQRDLLEPAARAIAEQLAAAKPNVSIEVAGRVVAKMAPSAGRWDWQVVSVDDLEPRIYAHANGDTADGLMFPARQLAEGAIELGAAVAEPTEERAPVLAPSNCLPLAPFPKADNDNRAAAPTVELEDWARGL